MSQKIVSVLLLFIIIFSFENLSAQNDVEEKVHLKNGSMYVGFIVEWIPNESLTIEGKDGNRYVVSMDDVAKVERTMVALNTDRKKSNSAEYKKKGYTNITELGVLIDLTKDLDSRTVMSFNTINGYQFSPYFSAGLGLGLDIYDARTYLPIFLDLRAYFLKGKHTPFAYTKVGMAFSLYNNPDIPFFPLDFDEGSDGAGLYFGLGMGYKVYLSKKIAYHINFGYQLQQSRYYLNGVVEDRLSTNLFVIKTGVVF